MKVARTVDQVREQLREPRQRGERIGLVPTMGALHAGHRSLLDAARSSCDVVVMSLFVNPSQFDAADDLARYPRDEAADAAVAADAGVDLLFAPAAAELFPPGFDTWVDPGALGEVLEGAARPGHFRGVATVCAKLFSIVGPDAAYFGEKDAQQVAVIRQVVRDLDLPVEIVAMPTIREASGLALSSRNRFLSPEERATALALPRALNAGHDAHHAGADAVAAARAVLDAEPGLSVDYVEMAEFGAPTLVAAIRVGATRLIDNVRLGG
ncbi:MAG: pantoate--beta-alanine ligase [Candidatus Limnocylindria bacterium]